MKAAGSPAVAAGENNFVGDDKRLGEIASRHVTIAPTLEAERGCVESDFEEAVALSLVLAASKPGSPGCALDSQKETSPRALFAYFKQCVAMKVLQAA